MIVDPQAVIDIIYTSILVIQEKVKDAKSNKHKCQRLLERVNAILEPLAIINKMNGHQKILFKNDLEDVYATLNKALQLVVSSSAQRTWISKLSSSQDQQKFEDIGKQLIKLTEILQFKIPMCAKSFKEEDENDGSYRLGKIN